MHEGEGKGLVKKRGNRQGVLIDKGLLYIFNYNTYYNMSVLHVYIINKEHDVFVCMTNISGVNTALQKLACFVKGTEHSGSDPGCP